MTALIATAANRLFFRLHMQEIAAPPSPECRGAEVRPTHRKIFDPYSPVVLRNRRGTFFLLPYGRHRPPATGGSFAHAFKYDFIDHRWPANARFAARRGFPRPSQTAGNAPATEKRIQQLNIKSIDL
jgi:hypothetical protein